MVPSLPVLSCESSVSVKENPDRKKKLRRSQRQAVIRLTEKIDKNKKFIQNWRPISLLNVDLRITVYFILNRFKNTLSEKL